MSNGRQVRSSISTAQPAGPEVIAHWSSGTVQSLQQINPAAVSFLADHRVGNEVNQMGREQNKRAAAPTLQRLAPGDTALEAGAGWESRLYSGLRMPRLPADTSGRLAEALGTLGVEAEYFLKLLAGFPANGEPSHIQGVIFLSQLEAAARRLYHTADTLEIATQGYLTALEASYPEVRGQNADTDPWWPAPENFELPGESIELRMRRCGFAYRHVVEVYLGANISAIASQMALVLNALTILPPAGVVPASSLYQGLYELSSAIQGHIVPRHIGDLDAQTPGLLTGISRLRRLDVEEETSLQNDLLWAQAQLESVQNFLKTAKISNASREWAKMAATEWRQTIQLLGTLRPPSRRKLFGR
jgi:hypothetical protein